MTKQLDKKRGMINWEKCVNKRCMCVVEKAENYSGSSGDNALFVLSFPVERKSMKKRCFYPSLRFVLVYYLDG